MSAVWQARALCGVFISDVGCDPKGASLCFAVHPRLPARPGTVRLRLVTVCLSRGPPVTPRCGWFLPVRQCLSATVPSGGGIRERERVGTLPRGEGSKRKWHRSGGGGGGGGLGRRELPLTGSGKGRTVPRKRWPVWNGSGSRLGASSSSTGVLVAGMRVGCGPGGGALGTAWGDPARLPEEIGCSEGPADRWARATPRPACSPGWGVSPAPGGRSRRPGAVSHVAEPVTVTVRGGELGLGSRVRIGADVEYRCSRSFQRE